MMKTSGTLSTPTTRVRVSGRVLKTGPVIVALVMYIATACPTTSRAGEPSDFGKVCSDQNAHRAFVTGSLKRVEEGADRERVLDTLVCIARGDGSDPLVGCGAVRAVFHIAKENQRIQEYLLKVITDERTKATTVSAACELFGYVSDENGRRELLDHVKRQWHAGCGNHGFQVLAEIGDVGFLAWLDETATGLDQDNPLRLGIDPIRKRIRLQRNVPELLSYLKSERKDIDRAWVVRQAMRHGATREGVRNATMAYLHRVAQESSPSGHLSVVRVCDEYGIFTAEDVRTTGTIRAAREMEMRFSGCLGSERI